jgi:transcriptional regulator with XRE-family HTH domain
MGALIQAVRKLQKTLGYSQTDFARRLGISLRAVGYYESDREPRGDVLRRLYSLAVKHNLQALAKTFADAISEESQGRATPATAEESAYVRAVLSLTRNRDLLPEWKLSADLIGGLEALVRVAPDRDRAAIEEALVELRYHAAPNAEKKIEQLARARSQETGEPLQKAYAHVVYERPDLYAEYLEDRAAAAKGTGFEGSMARGKRKGDK